MNNYYADVGKCRVHVEHLIRVSIEGEEPQELYAETELGTLKSCPDDGGLVREFVKWLGKSGLFNKPISTIIGGGVYSGFFDPKHRMELENWFEDKRHEDEI